MHRSQESCRVQASREGDQHTAAASVEDILVGARGHDTVPYRGVRKVSREGSRDSRPLCLDLQVHRR